VEISGVPAKHKRREGCVAWSKIGPAGFEVEGSDRHKTERTRYRRKPDADIDIHGDHAWNHGDRISPAEDLPRRDVSERGDGGERAAYRTGILSRRCG